MTPQEFAIRMQRELDSNESKGDWEHWHPILKESIGELMYHAGKIVFALGSSNEPAVLEHCADLGNICMKIASDCPRLISEREGFYDRN